MDWERLLTPSNLPLMIPIVAIVMGILYAIVAALIRHRERMAMIERGMHPDTPPQAAPSQQQQ